MKDLGGTLKVPQSSTKILNFGPEFVKLSILKAEKKKNSPKISPNFTLPKTRIQGIGIKFDTDPPKKCQRLEFEGLVSNLTPILRKNARTPKDLPMLFSYSSK